MGSHSVGVWVLGYLLYIKSYEPIVSRVKIIDKEVIGDSAPTSS